MVRELPVLHHDYADALPELVTPWRATEFPAPQPVLINEALAADLGLDVDWLRENPGMLVGEDSPLGGEPVAMAYAGHQFGVYVPRLGDGRALLLGELMAGAGTHGGGTDRTGMVDVHLKGSGPTPFSRGGDGLAVLGPMLREYVISEALHALGVPTSRSLAVTATGRQVNREISLPGAVLTRVAASHIRVGTFQLARADEGVLHRLTDYAIARHYPESTGDYLGFYGAVIRAQAHLIAQWMGIGFIHGVMNTDNTTISGESIDYGPCAFLDAYNPAAVFSSIDHAGRYAYRNQPAIAQWNLARFGETLLPLLGEVEQGVAAAQEVLSTFTSIYEEAHAAVFARKLGLSPGTTARNLTQAFLALLEGERLDFTNSFRALASGEAPSKTPEMAEWMRQWSTARPDVESLAKINPAYIPRNFALQQALNNAEDGDLRGFTKILQAIRTPYVDHPGADDLLVGGPAGFQTFCGT